MDNFTLHFIRHGESEWNALGRIQGQSNSDLSSLGRRQATATAAYLAPRPLAALYASDLDRAQQTAAALREQTGLDVVSDDRLRETHFGILEGLSWNDVAAQHPEIHLGLSTRDENFVIPGGESMNQTLERAVSACEDLAERHAGEQIAVVSHGGLIAYFLCFVLGLPLSTRRKFRVANCSIHTLERGEEGWRILTLGAVGHLYDVI